MEKKVALVTGGNRGIGFEVCRQLAQKGYHVILSSRDTHKGQRAVEKLRAIGLEVEYSPLDVTNPVQIQQLAATLSSRKLEVFVNNAGIYLDEGIPLLTTEADVVRKTMETNFMVPLQLIQTLVPIMKKQSCGRIVNVSSGYGVMSSMRGRTGAYRISKTALNAVTKIIADELRGTSIKVNAVCPGWVSTDMGGPTAPVSIEEGADTIVWLATLDRNGPTGEFFRNRQPIAW